FCTPDGRPFYGGTYYPPEPCGVRWDALLARELGWSRTRVARARAGGAIRIEAHGHARTVAHGDALRVVMP
ncbi:MAG: thioredoxin domain-containing protein, partial [Proteobacteria bacterium]